MARSDHPWLDVPAKAWLEKEGVRVGLDVDDVFDQADAFDRHYRSQGRVWLREARKAVGDLRADDPQIGTRAALALAFEVALAETPARGRFVRGDKGQAFWQRWDGALAKASDEALSLTEADLRQAAPRREELSEALSEVANGLMPSAFERLWERELSLSAQGSVALKLGDETAVTRLRSEFKNTARRRVEVERRFEELDGLEPDAIDRAAKAVAAQNELGERGLEADFALGRDADDGIGF